jgi:hypothetical protein
LTLTALELDPFHDPEPFQPQTVFADHHDTPGIPSWKNITDFCPVIGGGAVLVELFPVPNGLFVTKQDRVTQRFFMLKTRVFIDGILGA